MTTISGVWLPVVTPFHNSSVDFPSYERLLDHYLGLGISVFPVTQISPALAAELDRAMARV